MIIVFDTGDPAKDATPQADAASAKIKALRFLPVDLLRNLLEVEAWPGDDCSLL